MIQVHITEQFACADIYESFLGKISLFLGGPLVAPVFLAVMGYFTIASNKTTFQMIVRGLGIIGIGLLLNLCLNASLLFKIYSDEFQINPLNYIFGVDILFSAGIAIIIIALLKQIFNSKFYLYLFIALIIAFIAPYLNGKGICCPYLFAFIGGDFSWSYFPMFPWLAYPLAGAAFYVMKTNYEIRAISVKNRLILMGICMLVFIPFFKEGFETASVLSLYYHHGILFFGWCLSFIFFWVFLISFITEIKQGNKYPIISFLAWTGKNVTLFYFIQWCIIGNAASYILKSYGYIELIFSFIIITVLTSLLVFLIQKVRLIKIKKAA
ncbi:MAG: hypothetical protein A2275_18450 [Bacteroidetes bacterium RIFOXYA12_FULL_35_11]|nr:MAG: hypothetical protein A2X01_11365 [Bacteroidetes bacterium GWF2_35_48]OFY82782.1 MAG: hypothetical protein A2275_18450 [Bacteroidetes bacterium RIFOXYA12_FULL_35_11]OFZ00289.1 MAG: hypothetical protein A2491_04200 [Bacteroidetes bacterium RIFOXYC12_FULL_35_7]HBX51360.1 hypothetical protein [Bacteroidales bacterium]